MALSVSLLCIFGLFGEQVLVSDGCVSPGVLHHWYEAHEPRNPPIFTMFLRLMIMGDHKLKKVL